MNVDRKRQRANVRGRAGEIAAIALLIVRAHVILARRYKTPVGEIDIVPDGQANRLRRGEAAPDAGLVRGGNHGRDAPPGAPYRRSWLARHPSHQGLDIGFDIIFVTPWRLPVYLRDAL